MKLEAKVHLNEDNIDVTVLVDNDYVTNDEDEIKTYIQDELYTMYGKTITDFEVSNMSELLEDIAYDEFQNKVY